MLFVIWKPLWPSSFPCHKGNIRSHRALEGIHVAIPSQASVGSVSGGGGVALLWGKIKNGLLQHGSELLPSWYEKEPCCC